MIKPISPTRHPVKMGYIYIYPWISPQKKCIIDENTFWDAHLEAIVLMQVSIFSHNIEQEEHTCVWILRYPESWVFCVFSHKQKHYLVGGIPTPLKIWVRWDYYSHIYIWKNKSHVPNHHQPVILPVCSIYKWFITHKHSSGINRIRPWSSNLMFTHHFPCEMP